MKLTTLSAIAASLVLSTSVYADDILNVLGEDISPKKESVVEEPSNKPSTPVKQTKPAMDNDMVKIHEIVDGWNSKAPLKAGRNYMLNSVELTKTDMRYHMEFLQGTSQEQIGYMKDYQERMIPTACKDPLIMTLVQNNIDIEMGFYEYGKSEPAFTIKYDPSDCN